MGVALSRERSWDRFLHQSRRPGHRLGGVAAWQLQDAGYSVELDVWDWAPGEDFVTRMEAALERADRLLAVCSKAHRRSTCWPSCDPSILRSHWQGHRRSC
ncbi:toll/interleukin-1 receptor domain-containing protein [Geodermatophilus obscurus]|uniref:toll/interleukin-1 receptor domain-containing protein n=1 Tax=Geodermatophilus obscurus TaxID=1861 RepID=UPI001FCBA917|nr:toll/interleukin-1 receptor domain-containing protein [Geodermatophilus obscurus]